VRDQSRTPVGHDSVTDVRESLTSVVHDLLAAGAAPPVPLPARRAEPVRPSGVAADQRRPARTRGSAPGTDPIEPSKGGPRRAARSFSTRRV
jgi:hypothetical protein